MPPESNDITKNVLSDASSSQIISVKSQWVYQGSDAVVDTSQEGKNILLKFELKKVFLGNQGRKVGKVLDSSVNMEIETLKMDVCIL